MTERFEELELCRAAVMENMRSFVTGCVSSRDLERCEGVLERSPASEGWVGLCKPSVQGYFGCLRNLCVLNEGTIPDSTQNSSLSVL